MAAHGEAGHGSHRSTGHKALYAVIAVIVFIAALGVALTLMGGVPVIGAASTFNISGTGLVFSMQGAEYVATLQSISGSTAIVYITKAPVFFNQVIGVTLAKGDTVHVNYGTAYANMALTLKSIGSNVVTVEITPISTSLSIAPDSSLLKTMPPYSLAGKPQNVSIIKVGNTGNTISTANSISSSSSTTVTLSTVTVQPNVNSKALAVLEASEYYPLMLNYSTAYNNTLQCTPSQYNSTYLAQYGVKPAGQNTYQNVSYITPYSLNYTIGPNGGLFSVVYSTKAKASISTGSALVLIINTTSSTVQSANFQGVFSGLTYTQLYNSYAKMASVGGSCEAYFG